MDIGIVTSLPQQEKGSLQKEFLLSSNYQCVTLVCMYLNVVMTTNTFIEAHCVSGTILSSLPVKLSTTL